MQVDEPSSSVDKKRKHREEEEANGDKKHRSSRHKSSSKEGRESSRTDDKGRDKERDKKHEESRGGRDKEKSSKSRDDKERDHDKSKDRERKHDKDKDRDTHERKHDKDKERDKERSSKNRDREDGDKQKDHRADKSSRHDKDKQENGHRTKEKDDVHKGKNDRETEEREGGGSESSLSVAETNKIRAGLGLPLLVVDAPKDDTQKQQEREAAENEAKTLEITEKIEKMKNKRMLNAKLPGKSIAEENDTGDALAWVRKSKKIEQDRAAVEQATEQDKRLAAQRARMLDDLDEEIETESHYTSRDLAGLKVAHNMDAFNEESSEVLVLKDAPIVEGDDINAGEDELENVVMAEQEKRKRNKEAARKKPLYDVYGDEVQTVQNVLPQYDEEKKPEKMTLGNDGSVDLAAKNKLEEIRMKLQAGQRQVYDLDSTNSSSLASDYYTADEMAKFRRPATNRKKKMRRKETPSTALENQPTASSSSDHGSRATREVKVDQELAKDEERRRNYDKALEKAAATSKALYSTVVDEEDEALFRSLSRTNRGSALPKLESVAAAVSAAQVKREEHTTSEDAKNSVVFSATAEFVRNLNIEQQKDQDDYEEERKALVAKLPPPPRPAATPAAPEEDSMEVDTKPKSISFNIKKENENEEDEEEGAEVKKEKEGEEGVVEDEPLVAGGMAATLKLLAQKGGVKSADALVGRANDKRQLKAPAGAAAAPSTKEIIIERLDSQGRPMTTKQAFREQSYKFHGKKPGKNKQEKRAKQYEEQKRMMSASSSDTPLMTMQAMQNAQIKAGTAHIVLSSSSYTRGVPRSSSPPGGGSVAKK